MEKVKVTQEQANEINALLESPFDHTADELLELHAKRGGLSTIVNLDIDLPLLARFLYIGYEVMPEYPKKYDWVKYRINGEVVYGQIDTVAFNDVVGDFSHGNRIRLHKTKVEFMTPSEIATEKQRRWWKEHDRDVWELKEGDVIHKHISGILEVVKTYDANGEFEEYMASSTKNLFCINKSKDRIICFAEDRKDI